MGIFDVFDLLNSLPPTCANGKPYPPCGGGASLYYSGRGVTVNTSTCQCVSLCPSGKYEIGSRKCGTKAQQDAANAQLKRMYDCINAHGTWNTAGSGTCLPGGGGGGGYNDVDAIMRLLPYGVGAIILLLLVGLIAK